MDCMDEKYFQAVERTQAILASDEAKRVQKLKETPSVLKYKRVRLFGKKNVRGKDKLSKEKKRKKNTHKLNDNSEKKKEISKENESLGTV